MIDVAAVRKDTPACESLMHFNNAGASLMPRPVYAAVTGHLDLENRVGGYEAERRAQEDLAAFYSEFARFLNAAPEEIAFVENATRAWDMAFYALPLQEGDRILTHASEYVSNYLALLQQAKRRNLHIDLVPSDDHGQIDVNAIPSLIRSQTRLIAITHVPTQGGLVNPAEEVGRIAKEHDLWYLLDACQSVGQMMVDVKQIGCDFLAGTGRKFLRGPRGTGFLYSRRELADTLDPPFVDLSSARWTDDDSYELAPGAKRFENWESNVAGRIGLMHAIRYANALGLRDIENRVTSLASLLREKLAELPGVGIHDLGRKKCGIVTFTKSGVPPQALAGSMLKRGINISVSPRAIARLDFGARNVEALARASVHYYNTEFEIEQFAAELREMQ